MTPRTKEHKLAAWFRKQCCNHFAELLIGILLACMACMVSTVSAAGLWAYAMHGTVLSMQKDIAAMSEGMSAFRQDSREQWSRVNELRNELSTHAERISRVEVRQESN